METAAWKEISSLLAEGRTYDALQRCRGYWDRTGGPAPYPSGDDPLREFNRRLTVWQQIELYVWEVNRRPDNPRSWKLLGYAYMRAGLYIPMLLRAAEQALLASAARTEDVVSTTNLEEKVELCRRALGGDKEARAEIAEGERAFAESFYDFPAEVPMPEPFVDSGIVALPALKVTPAVMAPDLLEIIDG